MPGFKVWMTEQGVPYGPRGEISTWTNRGNVNANAPRDEGGKVVRSVMAMMQETWMPPKPEGAHAVHLDGDTENNSAGNLAWAFRKPHRAYREKWAERKLAEMSADPHHPSHGTRTGYDAGCRCRKCKNAIRLLYRISETRKTIRELEEACRTTTR